MENTLINLAKAFVGECQARNRYTYYSSVARKEGFEQIGAIFALTADQEKEHAKWLLRLINKLQKKGDGSIKVEAEVPTVLANTRENLKAAIAGENYEYTQMYPEFAKVAAREGHADIVARLRSIARAEEYHEERYKKLLKNVENKSVFKKAKKTTWVCRECGYVHEGKEAPKECPSCGHPQAFYEVKCERY